MNGQILLSFAAAVLSCSASLAVAGAEPRFRTVEIDKQLAIGYGLAIADVNGDHKPDVLLADKRLIVWYENPSWEKHVMAENLTPQDHVCIAAADLDGDGKAEVAAGAGWNPGDTMNSGAVFYLLPPSDRAQKWTPIKLYHEPTVHRMRWVKTASGTDLVVVPLHGKGNKDAQGAGVRILAYKMPPDPKQPWTTELIDDSLHLTHNFQPVQWDGDPAEELLVAGREGVFLFDRRDAKWEKTQLVGDGPGDPGFKGAGEIRTGKLPGGGRFLATVEPMHGNQLVVYTPPDPRSDSRLWRRKVLTDKLVDGHALACVDLTKAGSDQVVVGWRAMGKSDAKVGVKVFVPPSGADQDWTSVLVDDNGMACEDLVTADLNGDGRPDLIAAGRATKNLKVYFNTTGGEGQAAP